MPLPGAQLLRRLSSGIRPDGAAPRPPRRPIELSAFTELLRAAHRGELAGGGPVRVAPGAGIELSEAQLSRLRPVADAAAAAGARRMLAVIDGRALTIDVHDRSVVDEAPDPAGRILTDIDAAAIVPAAEDDDSADGSAPTLPRAGAPFAGDWSVRNPALAEVLAGSAPRDTRDPQPPP